MKLRHAIACLLALGASAVASAQDPGRGRALFADTRAATGKPVGNCVACHANREALRGMIQNRGADAGNAGAVRSVLQKAIEGAVPGARNAKAQYRGVLTPRDLDDLAGYIAKARTT